MSFVKDRLQLVIIVVYIPKGLQSEGTLAPRAIGPNNIVLIVLLPRKPTVMARASIVVSFICKTAYWENTKEINAIFTLPLYHQNLLLFF